MGCELSFIPEFDRYPAVFTRWEGAECQGYQACLYGHKLKHVRISGPGRINGNGQAWWDEFKRRNKEGISSPQNDAERKMVAANSATPIWRMLALGRRTTNQFPTSTKSPADWLKMCTSPIFHP